MFIIRSQGFFYTDEYYAPGDVFRRVGKRTFETREAAELARAAFVRRWIRAETLGDYVFDDEEAIEDVFEYMRAQWPGELADARWLYDVRIPKTATDAQVDEIVKRMGVTFAEVLEVDEIDGAGEGAGEDDEDEDDDDFVEDDDLHYGPR